MATLGDVITALRASVDRLPFTALADALDAAEEAHALIEQAAAGSGQAEFYQVLEWFRLAIEGMSDLQRQLSVVQASVTDQANRLEGSGRTSELLKPRSPATIALPDPQDAKAAELLARLPVRGPKNLKTAGYWIDDEGQEQELITSGRDELARAAGEVLRDLDIAPPRGELMTADHVEVKLAALLRGQADQNATLAVNNVPCNEGRWSCDVLLPRILRPGQRMTVFWPGGKKTYQGKDL